MLYRAYMADCDVRSLVDCHAIFDHLLLCESRIADNCRSAIFEDRLSYTSVMVDIRRPTSI